MFQTNLQYDFNVDGKAKHENVELNREENYVRIYVPPTGDADEMTMIHDYNKASTKRTKQTLNIYIYVSLNH